MRFVNDEARSYVARSQERFDTIQISLIDTWAATAAGAFVLSENSLYTVEAWTTFLEHLTDDGMLSVSRWYFQRPSRRDVSDDDARGRGAARARRDRPAPAHRRSSATCSWRTGRRTRPTASARFSSAGGRSATPSWTRSTASRRGCSSRCPFSPRASDRRDVRSADDARGTRRVPARAIRSNITAPTDDSPFFFNMLRLRDVVRPELLDFGKLSHNMKAVATLAVLLVTVSFLTAVCILLPLWLTRDRVNLSGAGAAARVLHRDRAWASC